MLLILIRSFTFAQVSLSYQTLALKKADSPSKSFSKVNNFFATVSGSSDKKLPCAVDIHQVIVFLFFLFSLILSEFLLILRKRLSWARLALDDPAVRTGTFINFTWQYYDYKGERLSVEAKLARLLSITGSNFITIF